MAVIVPDGGGEVKGGGEKIPGMASIGTFPCISAGALTESILPLRRISRLPFHHFCQCCMCGHRTHIKAIPAELALGYPAPCDSPPG